MSGRKKLTNELGSDRGSGNNSHSINGLIGDFGRDNPLNSANHTPDHHTTNQSICDAGQSAGRPIHHIMNRLTRMRQHMYNFNSNTIFSRARTASRPRIVSRPVQLMALALLATSLLPISNAMANQVTTKRLTVVNGGGGSGTVINSDGLNCIFDSSGGKSGTCAVDVTASPFTSLMATTNSGTGKGIKFEGCSRIAASKKNPSQKRCNVKMTRAKKITVTFPEAPTPFSVSLTGANRGGGFVVMPDNSQCSSTSGTATCQGTTSAKQGAILGLFPNTGYRVDTSSLSGCNVSQMQGGADNQIFIDSYDDHIRYLRGVSNKKYATHISDLKNRRTQLLNTKITSLRSNPVSGQSLFVHCMVPSGQRDVSVSFSPILAPSLTISVPPGTTVEKVQEVSADFVSARASHVFTNQLSMIGFITGSNNNGGGPLGDLRFNSDLNSQTTMSFYTSRSKMLGVTNTIGAANTIGATKGDRVGLSFANDGDDKSVSSAGAASSAGSGRTGTFDVWTQIQGAQSTQGKAKGTFWTAGLGTHYFLEEDMLIGLMGQFDWSDQKNVDASTNLASKVTGTGFMVGPYISGKIKDQALYYEARGLWGQSDNKINPIGTDEDKFKTNRLLGSVKLEGSHVIDGFSLGDMYIDNMMLKPSVSLSYFQEVQKAYTNSGGQDIPEQTISLGEFRFGPTLTRSFDLGDDMGEGYRLTTNVGLSGIVTFGESNGAGTTSTSNTLGTNKTRARIDGGIAVENGYGIRFTAAGFYDGVGAKNYSSYGGRLGILIPLN